MLKRNLIALLLGLNLTACSLFPGGDDSPLAKASNLPTPGPQQMFSLLNSSIPPPTPSVGDSSTEPPPAIYPPGQTPQAPHAGADDRYPAWLFDGPEGQGFPAYLAREYRRLAKHENDRNDFHDASHFLVRAETLDRGEMVDPERLAERTLPVYAVQDLIYARLRLVRVLNNRGPEIYPRQTAFAQAMFDCWMEEQEENIQAQDVEYCRNRFEETIVRLERSLMPNENNEFVQKPGMQQPNLPTPKPQNISKPPVKRKTCSQSKPKVKPKPKKITCVAQ